MASITAAFVNDPVELWSNASEDDLQLVIRAVYKQLLGNAHLLESQRLTTAESLLRNRDITVREFVRMIAQSNLYQSLFFQANPAYRFIELNCKHLLGRAPLDQAEISQHVQLYNTQGYAAEIDSYIDSQEYLDKFGENVVPYPCSISSQMGVKNNVYNRTLALLGGFATSDSSNKAKLIASLAANQPQKIKLATTVGGATGATNKRFRITAAKGSGTTLAKRSNLTYEVGYSQLSAKIQSIHKMGGKILSITEV
jgi:hypothetical protein